MPEIDILIATNSGELVNNSFEFAKNWFNSQTVIAAFSSGIFTLFLTRYFESVNKKRKLFAEAYKTALSWQEMLYRVRKRSRGLVSEQKLIDKFHNIQEQIYYFTGLIYAESLFLGSSYERFVKKVKSKNSSLIQKAWESHIRKPSQGTLSTDVHPNTIEDARRFLYDARDWLSPWQFPKLFVLWRFLWRNK